MTKVESLKSVFFLVKSVQERSNLKVKVKANLNWEIQVGSRLKQVGWTRIEILKSKFLLVESTKKMFVGRMRKQIRKRVKTKSNL
jgi:hypothetical protein